MIVFDKIQNDLNEIANQILPGDYETFSILNDVCNAIDNLKHKMVSDIDFNDLSIETYQTKPNHVKQSHSKIEDQRKIKRARYFCRMEQLRIARYRKEIYRPKNIESNVTDKWVQACKQERWLCDWYQHEGHEQKQIIEGEWVEKI